MGKRPQIIFFVFFIVLCRFTLSNGAEKAMKTVCIKDVCVQAEVAYSEEEKTRGLMNRKNLAWKSGMVFIFDVEAQYSFWMKNMSISLDVIWIDSNKNIVDITKNVLPCKEDQVCGKIIPISAVKYVLEVNSGFTEHNKIRIGDKVSF